MMADAMARFGIFGGVLMLLRWLLTRPSVAPERRETAGELIERRYANGEIDRETYLRMLEDIKDTAD